MLKNKIILITILILSVLLKAEPRAEPKNFLGPWKVVNLGKTGWSLPNLEPISIQPASFNQIRVEGGLGACQGIYEFNPRLNGFCRSEGDPRSFPLEGFKCDCGIKYSHQKSKLYFISDPFGVYVGKYSPGFGANVVILEAAK